MDSRPLNQIDATMLTRERFYSLLNFLSDKWWFFYGIAVAVLVVTTINLKPIPSLPLEVTAVTVNYAEVFLEHGSLLPALLEINGLIIGSALLALKKRSFWYGIGLFCLTIALLFAYALVDLRINPPNFEEMLYSMKNLQSEQNGDYVYRLLRYEKWGIDRPIIHYNLYHCDSESTVCNRLTHYTVGFQIVDLGKDMRSPGRFSFLNGDILLVVEGELVYRAPLDALPTDTPG